MNDLTIIKTLPTETLIKQLEEFIGITANTVEKIGAIWRELENRKVDLSSYKRGLLEYMPMVANGELAPELLVKLCGKKTLLKTVAMLPISVQRKLLGEKLNLISFDDKGSVVQTTKNIEELEINEISIALDPVNRNIRSVTDQKRLLTKHSIAKKIKNKQSRTVTLKIYNELYKILEENARYQKITVETFIIKRLSEF